MSKPVTPIERRFWRHVHKTDGCWLWTGCLDKRGYGKLSDGGKTKIASRVAYALAYGEIPVGKNVCHSCDTPACVRPDHLFAGDQKANAVDAKKKGRLPRGEKHPMSKITQASVHEIRSRRESGEPLVAIAEDYGISFQQVSLVARRKNWAWL